MLLNNRNIKERKGYRAEINEEHGIEKEYGFYHSSILSMNSLEVMGDMIYMVLLVYNKYWNTIDLYIDNEKINISGIVASVIMIGIESPQWTPLTNDLSVRLLHGAVHFVYKALKES